MKLLVTLNDGSRWELPMLRQDDVFCQGSSWHEGYVLDTDDDLVILTALDLTDSSDYFDELMRSSIYEGREATGARDDLDETFSWEMLPETDEERQHIEAWCT